MTSVDDDADRVLAEHGRDLAAAVVAALPEWSERVVRHLVTAWRGEVDATVAAEAHAAGRTAAEALGPELVALLAADVDDQRTNPLAVARRAVAWPAAVLRDVGVPPVGRDAEDERHFPDDVYGLTPWSFADIDPGLQELAIGWGAAKARAHLVRHRGGRR